MRGWLFRLSGLCAIVLYCILAAAQSPIAAQPELTATRRADLQATMLTRRTPLPPRYSIQGELVRLLEKTNFSMVGLGAMAVDADGSLYIGDGMSTVYVLAPDLTEQRQFKVQQPFALAMDGKGMLYIGQRYQVNIGLYKRDGSFVRRFWFQSDATLDTLAVAPDDTLYVAWQTNNLPRAAYLSHLDAAGNLLYTREFAHPVGGGNVVHSITFEPKGNVNITVTGFGWTADDTLAEFVALTPLGDVIRGRPVFVINVPVKAPAVITRLKDGSLVMFSFLFVGWWDTDARIRQSVDIYPLRGGVPRSGNARQAAVALRPDGESVFWAEMHASGEVQVSVIRFVDTLAPTPTVAPTATPTGTAPATP
jgi:hypothetical protein